MNHIDHSYQTLLLLLNRVDFTIPFSLSFFSLYELQEVSILDEVFEILL